MKKFDLLYYHQFDSYRNTLRKIFLTDLLGRL